MRSAQRLLHGLRSRRFEKFLKHAFAAFLGLFVSRERVSRIPLESIQKILVIRQHNQLGDMLCAVPLLRALRQRFPSARIDLVASPVNYEIMLLNPFINDVLLYNKGEYFRSPWKLTQFVRKLRATGYDLAIVPSTVSVSFTSDLLAYLAGAKYRIGAGRVNGIENIASHFFNLPLDLNWDGQPNLHQTERNLEYVRRIGVGTNDFSAVIHFTEEEKKFASDFLCHAAVGKTHIIGFHPGAGKLPNRWPSERFATVADRIASDLDAAVVITAGPMDEEPVARMTKNIHSPFLLVKEDDVRMVAAIIDRLSLYITNDTGMMHVAGATATSVLSLFGPSDPYQWAPRSARSRFLLAQDGDIDSISEDEVIAAAIEMLRGR